MNDRERRRILEDSRRRLGEFIEGLPSLLSRIYESQSGGYRSPRFDGSGRTPTLHCFDHGRDNCKCGQNTTIATATDQTGETATSAAGVTLRNMDLHVTAIAKALTDMHAIYEEFFPTQDELDRLVHPDADDPDMPVCEVVARAKDKRGKSRVLEPMLTFSDVNGTLPNRMRLGRWAYDFVRDTGHLPSMEQIEAHIEGRQVRRKAS